MTEINPVCEIDKYTLKLEKTRKFQGEKSTMMAYFFATARKRLHKKGGKS